MFYSLVVSVTGQHCEARQHPESSSGDDRLKRRGVGVAGEMERLEASTEAPLSEVLPGLEKQPGKAKACGYLGYTCTRYYMVDKVRSPPDGILILAHGQMET